ALLEGGTLTVEIRSVNGKNIIKQTDEEVQAIYDKLTENGISVWSVGSPLGKIKISELDGYMDTVERTCQIANILHADKIRMFSFFEAYENREEVMNALKEMAAIGKKYGVTMCHENEKEIYGDTLERVEDIMAQGIDNLKFIFDPANFIQCGEKIAPALDKVFDKIYYFHIKDVIAETGELVPAGYGDGAIDYMSELIAKSGNDYVMTVEPHLKVFAGYGNIDNTEMKNKFTYETNAESFDAAVNGLKAVLTKAGYKETDLDAFNKAWVK
ncbi:MAG: sugar phosphate isomerase/epimerase, partial [Clostridia bacterium]|nr:sugar phosphate isomerase/epimerase [Clostridia bacterium]